MQLQFVISLIIYSIHDLRFSTIFGETGTKFILPVLLSMHKCLIIGSLTVFYRIILERRTLYFNSWSLRSQRTGKKKQELVRVAIPKC